MRWLLLLLLIASPGLWLPSASALTINVIGANGAAGDDGEAAVAAAVSGDASNSAGAFGGAGGAGRAGIAPGDGGFASATATTAGAPEANARAEASGGNGGDSVSAEDGGMGGGAMASAFVEGSLSATAYARAVGGGGGRGFEVAGGVGGAAAATASARTSGDGHAVLAGAADPLADNIGSQGGNAGSFGTSVAGGDASSESIGEALGNSSVRVIDGALGGNGGSGGGGGTARSSAVGRNAGAESVEVEARAFGGQGGTAVLNTTGGRGGEAELGTVYGLSSGGGAVSVVAQAVGGDGGWGLSFSSVPTAGDGASVQLHNSVDGDTSGSLYLEQYARGGRAGEHGGGAHGETSCTLDISKSAQALEIAALAVGAHDAESAGSAENDTGSVTVHSLASGGDGRLPFEGIGERGGDGRAHALGQTLGDGHAVLVTTGCSDCANAIGGRGAGLNSLSSTQAGAGGGRGGDAESLSEGIALGDSAVTVEDRAIGGDGGFGPGSSGTPGEGGAARSSASAVGNGSSAVHASASAAGGRGGDFSINFGVGSGSNGRGGHANAHANAQGLGEVVALANATGGSSGALRRDVPGVSGNAHAGAVGIGTSGHAAADAFTAGGELARLHLTATASLHSGATVDALIDGSGAFQRTPLGRLDAFAIASQLPGSSVVDAAIGDSPQVAAAFGDDAIGVVLGLGQIGFAGLQDAGDGSLSQSARIEIIPNVFQVSVLQDVVLGFVKPESIGTGFDSLHFRAAMGDTALADVTFDDPDAARVYFDDRVLDLGSFVIGGVPPVFFRSALVLEFDWIGSELGSAFGVDWIIGLTPIPEPSTALLLALGLAVMAARARRRRGAAI